MIVLLRHRNAKVFLLVSVCYFICNMPTFFQFSTYLLAEETLDELLLAQKYETALEFVTEKLLIPENYDDSSSEILKDFNTAVYLYVILKKTDEGEHFAEKMRLQYDSHYQGINFIKGVMECYNDNYGNAEKSFVREINVCLQHIEFLETKNDASIDDYILSFKNGYLAMQMKACVTAVRGEKQVLHDDLKRLESIRFTCKGLYLYSTNPEIPQYIETKQPGINALEVFSRTINEPDIVFYRTKGSLPPPTKSSDSNVIIISTELAWGSNCLFARPDDLIDYRCDSPTGVCLSHCVKKVPCPFAPRSP
ncbi:MAG: hypothetical protein FWH27_15910 [Planctomycetaceae bacterium]|nr:hypothetical protein [Planctomycetaceae bacterium]